MTEKEKTKLSKKKKEKEKKELLLEEIKTELDRKKNMLYKLIDDLTELDYVEVKMKISDVTLDSDIVYQIYIEKEGNIIIHEK